MATILIIDDDTHIRQLLRAVFEALGHQIVEATNGREALGALQTISPSLVVVDILMPEMDGIEMIRTIRKTTTDIKIIAMSGGLSIEGVDALDVAQRLGATRTMHKPFAIRGLINMVQDLLAPEPIQSAQT